MALQDAWKRISIDTKGEPVKHVWDEYLAKEKVAYANILKTKTTRLEGTVAQLAENLRLSPTYMFAFLDGIHEAVDGMPALDTIEEDTAIAFDIEYDRLFKQMVEYKADDLYTMPEWNDVFTPERQKELYKEQKNSHTVVRNEAKTGRNEACPCGSGKKFKKCCGGAA